MKRYAQRGREDATYQEVSSSKVCMLKRKIMDLLSRFSVLPVIFLKLNIKDEINVCESPMNE